MPPKCLLAPPSGGLDGDSKPPSRSSSRPGSPGISSPTHRTIPPAHLTIGDEMGKNPFRRVHRGRHKRRDIVVLRYPKGGPNNGRECQILTQLTLLNPPYIPEVCGISVDGETISIVQELSTFGSLKSVLQNERLAAQLTPAHRVAGAAQLARAMAFLESEHVVHADLKSSNVLVFQIEPEEPSRIVLKITDFGLALLLDEGKDFICLKQPRAVRWCAPETIFESKLSYHSDCWSLGTTMWEFFSGGVDPWSRLTKRSDVSDQLREIGERLCSGDTASLDAMIFAEFARAPGCPAGAHATILECLRADEMKRLTFGRVAERLEGATDLESYCEEVQDVSGNADSLSSAGRKSSLDQQRLSVLSKQLEEAGSPRHSQIVSFGMESEVEVQSFELIKEFLKGPMAAEVCDENMVRSIWAELREAQVRENYLKDQIQAVKSVCVANFGNGTAGEAVQPWEGTPGVSPMRSRPSMLPWILWTFDPLRRSLQSQEFFNEAEALESFRKMQSAGPCMLRDPSGAECAARSWVSSYFSIAPTGAMLPDLRPPMPPAWPIIATM